MLWCAAWAFVLISWLLANLLGELFDLIGIGLIKMRWTKAGSCWMLIGGAFGAAVGLLRDRDKVLGLLQRVVTTVLSVLAPVLAAGLVLFVLALPFTGLDVLWEKTRTPTPVMLACVAGAAILANAVIGNNPDEEARGTVLRWSAMALGAVAAPLVAVAAISTALRIGQYGFTPSRLWGVVAVARRRGRRSLLPLRADPQPHRLGGARPPGQCQTRHRHLHRRTAARDAARPIRRDLDPLAARPARIRRSFVRPNSIGGQCASISARAASARSSG